MNFQDFWGQLLALSPNLSLDPYGTIPFLFKSGQGLTQPFLPIGLPCRLPRLNDQFNLKREMRRERGPYRKYTYGEKKQAVQRIQRGQDVKVVSKDYGIPRRNLSRWKTQGFQHKKGAGRPISDQEMQKAILAKIQQGQLSDQNEIRKQAILLSNKKNFKASKSWFFKFCKRNQLKLTRNVTCPMAQFVQKAKIQPTDLHLS